jgi:estrogen-related receptor beta like 1
MNGEITSLSKKLHSVKSKVDEKGNMMTDTSPLIRIKTTLRGIKAEIRDYDLQIGILEHNLVQRRLAKVNT